MSKQVYDRSKWRQYYINREDKIKEDQRRYREENKEAYKEYQRKYREANKVNKRLESINNSPITQNVSHFNKLIVFVERMDKQNYMATMEDIFVDMIGIFTFYFIDRYETNKPAGHQLQCMWNQIYQKYRELNKESTEI